MAGIQRPRTREEIEQMKMQERNLANRSLKTSDYEVYDENRRRELIVSYVNFIKDMGFKPVKIFGQPDPKQTISFRGMFEFVKPNTVQINRKHTAFFESRNWTYFSLRSFEYNVLNTTEMKNLNDFTKALRIRIWNIGYTDEEIMCALLGRFPNLEIKDVVEDGKLIIPKDTIEGLFFDLNILGGNQKSSRIINRKKG